MPSSPSTRPTTLCRTSRTWTSATSSRCRPRPRSAPSAAAEECALGPNGALVYCLEYLEANLDLIGGRRPGQTCRAVAPGAEVDASATVVASIVADGAVVAAGARVERSVVLAGASVGQGSTVTDSVVMGRLAERSTVVRCVIGANAVVDVGEHLTDERRPDPDNP